MTLTAQSSQESLLKTTSGIITHLLQYILYSRFSQLTCLSVTWTHKNTLGITQHPHAHLLCLARGKRTAEASQSHHQHPGHSPWTLGRWLAQLCSPPHTHHHLPPRHRQSTQEDHDAWRAPVHRLWPPSPAHAARVPCRTCTAPSRRAMLGTLTATEPRGLRPRPALPPPEI